jgi:hypothetical protein
LRFQGDVCALDWTVLRIMNDAANGTEDRGKRHRIQEKKDRHQAAYFPHKIFPRCEFTRSCRLPA